MINNNFLRGLLGAAANIVSLRPIVHRLMGVTQQNGYERQALAAAAMGAAALVIAVLALLERYWFPGALMLSAAYWNLGIAWFLWNEKDKGKSRPNVEPWPQPGHGARLTRIEKRPRSDAEIADRLIRQFEENLEKKVQIRTDVRK